MRYGELFAGAGGMSLGLERAGLSCAFHAEIADFPRRVLRHRWPDTPLYGDVSTLDGRELVASHGPIDLLAGGSPCQDLSVAGKRAGLGGARSGLFYQQLRLWEETGATYLLWENVAGALSSNNGKDFAAVLSAIVGATVTVPRDGWGGEESGGGVAAGPRAVAAWRLLDAQYFGVPQRRLRVFVLGARASGVDPAEVLLEPEGVRRNPPTRGEAGQRVADSLTVGANQTCGFPGDVVSGDEGSRLAIDTYNQDASQRVFHSLRTGGLGDSVPAVLSFGWQNSAHQGDEMEAELSAPLRVKTTPAVMAFAQNVRGENLTSDVAYSLSGGGGKPGQGYSAVCATGDVSHALTHEGHDASEDGTGRGTPIVAYFDKQSLGEYGQNGVASTDSARDYKDATDLVVGTLESREKGGGFPGSDGAMAGHVQPSNGIPRRLMPIECERLMGWPDHWTAVPDEKGKPASDAVRYKACGNGVVSHVPEWIAGRLLAMELAVPPAPEDDDR